MVDVVCSWCYSNNMDNTEHTMEQVDTRSFEEMIATPMTELEELENIYCEMHKDVYGVKARWYRATSVEQARKDIDSLQQALEVQMAQDKIYQQEAIKAFQEVVDGHCGGCVETAKRWQHQAYGTDGDDEYLAHRLGLPYGYFKKAA